MWLYYKNELINADNFDGICISEQTNSEDLDNVQYYVILHRRKTLSLDSRSIGPMSLGEANGLLAFITAALTANLCLVDVDKWLWAAGPSHSE